MKEVTVETKNPKWIRCSYFPYKMLHKRYQFYLIEQLKKEINKNINSDNPDPDLKVFLHPDAMKSFFDDLQEEYKKGFYVHVSED